MSVVNRLPGIEPHLPMLMGLVFGRLRERLAAEFAEQFAIDHRGIDDAMWERMSQHFSDVELLELTITCGFCVGIGRAFQVLDVARDFDVLWSREPPGPSPSTTDG